MNSSEFQNTVLKAEQPVVLDFWAPWCAPCRRSKPILEKLAGEYAGRVEFIPVNADDSPEVLRQLKIYGIPTVLVFRNGAEAGRVTGAQSEEAYRSAFEALASGAEVKTSISRFDRLLRLGGGGLLIIVGIATGSWLAVGAGLILGFLGIYDRCPVWKALTGRLRGE